MLKIEIPPPGLSIGSFASIRPEDIQWVSYPAAGKEGYTSVLVGKPSVEAPYVVRVKVGAGAKILPHIHPEDRIYTVISGIFYIGQGEAFDSEKLVAYPPGSVIVLPGNTPHFHWAKSGEYVTQIYGTGPLGTEYINPMDDPRK